MAPESSPLTNDTSQPDPGLTPPELDDLELLLQQAGSRVEIRQLCLAGRERFPVHMLSMGCSDPDAGAIAFVGGVHGLERIGAQVVIAYLRSLINRLHWDTTLHHQLEQVRLIFVPIVNPGGMARHTRANPNGVDLMRNAPIDALEKVPFLVGGQRISASLPWFRGVAGAPMEVEAQALCDAVESELLTHRFSIAVDCHSGFGLTDRIWFPYAHTAEPIPHLAEMHALMTILDQSHAHHRYVFEPQSRQYLAHGDLWDHLYRRSLVLGAGMHLPLTLEMGSWAWVKKNPRQIFSRLGLFNPLLEHREQRVLRRHLFWFEFLVRATAAHALWLPEGEERTAHECRAQALWYGGSGA